MLSSTYTRENAPLVRGDFRIIAAVGRHGQIGYKGRLPWSDPEDLQWFYEQTKSCIVVLGSKTFDALLERRQTLEGHRIFRTNGNRTVFRFSHRMGITDILKEYKDRSKPLWIAGGTQTYKAWMEWAVAARVPVRAHLNLNAYDGPADTYMPDLWGRNDGVQPHGVDTE